MNITNFWIKFSIGNTFKLAVIMKLMSYVNTLWKIVLCYLSAKRYRPNVVNTSIVNPHFSRSNVLHSDMCDIKHSIIIKSVLVLKLC